MAPKQDIKHTIIVLLFTICNIRNYTHYYIINENTIN